MWLSSLKLVAFRCQESFFFPWFKPGCSLVIECVIYFRCAECFLLSESKKKPSLYYDLANCAVPLFEFCYWS